jgi:hypothetical protein
MLRPGGFMEFVGAKHHRSKCLIIKDNLSAVMLRPDRLIYPIFIGEAFGDNFFIFCDKFGDRTGRSIRGQFFYFLR